MKYKLGMKEMDELMVDGEFVSDREDIRRKKVEIFEDEDIIRLKTESDIIESNEMAEPSLYKMLNNAFRDVEFSKKTKKITNIVEIQEKLKEIRNNILYDISTPVHVIEDIMTISSSFENVEWLHNSLIHYNLIPYLRNIDFNNLDGNNGIEKDLIIYGLLAQGAITYKTKYYVKQEYDNGKDKYEIIFAGKGSVPSMGPSLETSIKSIMKTPKDGIYYVYADIKGKYIYSTHLERLVININFLVEQIKDLNRYDYSRKKILIDLSKEEV